VTSCWSSRRAARRPPARRWPTPRSPGWALRTTRRCSVGTARPTRRRSSAPWSASCRMRCSWRPGTTRRPTAQWWRRSIRESCVCWSWTTSGGARRSNGWDGWRTGSSSTRWPMWQWCRATAPNSSPGGWVSARRTW